MAERRREHAGRLDLAVRKHDDRRLLHDVGDLVLGEEAEAPVDPLRDTELTRELLVRLGGLDRVARYDETDVRHLLRDRRQRADEEIEPLRAADEPEEEERRAVRRRDLARRREDGVRDPHDLRASTPSAASCSTAPAPWTTTRSTVENTRRQRSSLSAVRRGSTS